jgi:hypothetical protein
MLQSRLHKIATSIEILIVTGCILSITSADPSVQTLNGSVVFLEETDIFLTDDSWRITIEIDINPYEEAISTIRADLLAVKQLRKNVTFTSELQSIETLMTTLESKLHSFKQILPKLDPRRGLLNLGGTMLKALFGIAVVSDVTQLHNIFDELLTLLELIHLIT